MQRMECWRWCRWCSLSLGTRWCPDDRNLASLGHRISKVALTIPTRSKTRERWRTDPRLQSDLTTSEDVMDILLAAEEFPTERFDESVDHVRPVREVSPLAAEQARLAPTRDAGRAGS